MAAEGWEGDLYDTWFDGPLSMDGRKKRQTKMGTLVALTIHETDRAWLVRVEREKVWLPKSQCSRELGDIEGDIFSIPEWLVNRAGIDQFVEYQ